MVAWGAYSLPSIQQSRRIAEIGRLIRENPARYAEAMAPDPERASDARGELYWGSFQHVLESALRLLSQKMEEKKTL